MGDDDKGGLLVLLFSIFSWCGSFFGMVVWCCSFLILSLICFCFLLWCYFFIFFGLLHL